MNFMLKSINLMNNLCGMDEVGRGALAGPLVLAGVILPDNFEVKDVVIRDSKKMSILQRNKAKEYIEKHAIKIEVEVIDVDIINKKGIGWANIYGFLKLIEKINADKYIVDGNLKFENPKIESVIGGDNKYICISSASIIAKCFRDNLMRNLHPSFPEYGFLTNVGYGTKIHLEALKKYGITKHHRLDFVCSSPA